MATLEGIRSQIAKLQAQADAVARKESSKVLEKIRGIMDQHGLTSADIAAYVGQIGRGRKTGVTSSITSQSSDNLKYRDPKTGASWTGHGRAPAWIADAKDRSIYLADTEPEMPVSSNAVRAREGAYVRGPQPAKYRDPKSGATWSGRGPAPAWLATVKDRNKFLITESAQDTREAQPTKQMTAAAKKPAGKKTSVKTRVTAKKVDAKNAASLTAPQENSAKTTVAKKAAAKGLAPKKATVSTTAGKLALEAGPASDATARKAAAKKPVVKKPVKAEVAVKKAAAGKVSGTKTTGTKAAGKKTSTTKAAVKKVVSKKKPTAKAANSKVAAKKPTASGEAVKEAVATQASTPATAANKTVARKATAGRIPAKKAVAKKAAESATATANPVPRKSTRGKAPSKEATSAVTDAAPQPELNVSDQAAVEREVADGANEVAALPAAQ
ncbi:H-NS histone family protein [Paraburkholderia bengalensis]|uniref:H-NS histone family protein n=1 Tax=Paraburkholderia bengalensis TaxID=2747562 RepID=A0ABU8J2K3_9BURK